MVDEMRRQLDALMGADRNGDLSISSFQDPQVCKLYLAGLCPNELFNNTRRSMPPCKKVHSLPLKAKYDEERQHKDFGYEDELERLLRSIVRDCDREIDFNKRKLEEEEQTKLVDPFERQIKELEERQAALGEEGNLDEFMKIGQQIEELKVQRNQKSVTDLPEGEVGDLIAQHGPNGPQHQALRVCEICSSYLSSKDDEKRLQDHYIGKLHQGFQTVREKLAELEKRPDRNARAVEERSYDRRDDRGSYRGGGGYDRDYDRHGGRGGRDRGYGGRDYQDRDRDYRSRERDYRDHGRGRGGYHRDYDRDRDRRRRSRSRSRSRSPRRDRDNRDRERDYDRRRDRSPSPSRVRPPVPPSSMPQQPYYPPQ